MEVQDISKQNEENKQGSTSNVSQLTQMVERLEKENKEAKEILAKYEQLLAKKEELIALDKLSGSTLSVQPPKPKEETPQEYAKRISSGRL